MAVTTVTIPWEFSPKMGGGARGRARGAERRGTSPDNQVSPNCYRLLGMFVWGYRYDDFANYCCYLSHATQPHKETDFPPTKKKKAPWAGNKTEKGRETSTKGGRRRRRQNDDFIPNHQ